MVPAAITFRPVTPADVPLLHEWLGRPHVAAWWHAPRTLDEVEQDYCDPASTTRAFLACRDGEPFGFIQAYVAMDSGDGWWEDVRDPGVRGIDQFLANADQLGQGLGSAMVRAFVEELFRDPSVTLVQTDPSPANARAIRCYEKAGFHAVGEVETPDGRALLMHRERTQ